MPTENKVLQFDRDQILNRYWNRYWELAILNSDKTKGSIIGQLKALDSLSQELAQTQAAKPRKTPPPLQIYRSGWRKES